MARTEVTSRGIIIKEGRILLIHRRKGGVEYYVLPGGGVEDGETPEQTIKREVYEETGLKVTDIHSNFQVTDINNKQVHIFYASVEEGIPTLVGEEKEVNCENDWYNPEWFDVSIIEKPNVYPSPAIEILRKELFN